MQVEIIKWDKYNARSDVKHPTWFRMDHSLFDDPQLFELNGYDLLTFIYLLSLASKKSAAAVNISPNHAEKVGRIPKKFLKSAIAKLAEVGVIRTDADVHDRMRTDTSSTLQTLQTDKTDNTDTGRAESLFELAALWNETIGEGFPKVEECNGTRLTHARARWKAKPQPQYWIEVFRKVSQNDFLSGGGDKGWVATFDWIVKPGNAAKVMEGTYDRKPGANGSNPADEWLKKKMKEQEQSA